MVWASLVLTAFALVFLSGAILNFSSSYFAPADILQSFPAFLIQEKTLLPHNYVVSDDILQFVSWLEFSRRSLSNGEIPLWNPFNGGGRPLLGNMQSAIFNPVNWPELLLGHHFGLVIKSFLNLFLSGLFSFLFFRQLKALPVVALAGAVAVEFMGFQVVWLLGTLGTTFTPFFLMLYLIEKRLNGSAKSLFVTGTALAVAWSIFAGHIETVFLNILTATLYFAFRLLSEKRAWGNFLERLKTFGLYVAGGVLGVLLAAVQLWPFLEYLLNSYVT